MVTEYIDPNRQPARDTFHGKTLTDSQFDEAYAISAILHREILKSGSFREKLTDYAHAFARDQRFDALKGEDILRDVFKGRYDQSMNQMREGLMEREAIVQNSGQDQALRHANSILAQIKDVPQPFYKAHDAEGVGMARKHGITEIGAKKMMAETHEKDQGRTLYKAGKELEAVHYTPIIEAARAQRRVETADKTRTPARVR
jgi:hypothetical protein